jgi:hypothetical protein
MTRLIPLAVLALVACGNVTTATTIDVGTGDAAADVDVGHQVDAAADVGGHQVDASDEAAPASPPACNAVEAMYTYECPGPVQKGGRRCVTCCPNSSCEKPQNGGSNQITVDCVLSPTVLCAGSCSSCSP